MWHLFQSPRRRANRGFTPVVEAVEARVLLSASPVKTPASPSQTVPVAKAVESINGTGNNLAQTAWGSAGVDLLRKAAAAYGDGISTPAGQNRPSAREISNALSDQGGLDIVSDRGLSAMAYAWGQFIDHDMDLTPTNGTEKLSIKVPTGDPAFDPLSTGTKTITTTRSVYDSKTGTSASNPRQQINTVTAFLDGSMIYGSDAQTAATLRTFQGGHMATSEGNLLPLNNTDDLSGAALPMANDSHLVPDSELFAAGDVRANENIELTSLQTLFVREHNFQADKIARENPQLSDEAIYQRARGIVIGELQAITYNEWLPTLLGPNALKAYSGYKSTVNPGITNEFSTAAFRFGHSMLGDDVEFLDNNGQPIRDEISLSEAFFNPDQVSESGIDPILKYLTADPSSEIDLKVVDSVRNFLFGPPGAGGLDLVSLNIERGRDNGLADYNTVRQAYGLPKVTKFSQITSDTQLQAKLQKLYGNVNNIDLWVGALAEDHVAGASVGATTKAILADQFTRLRDGDRFWYQNQFQGQALDQISHTSLSDIIKRNTQTTNVQHNVFVFQAGIAGAVKIDQNKNGKPEQQEPAAGKQTVQLVDKSSGEVVASTVTDPKGQYHFDVQDGLRTGAYTVRVQAPAGQTGVQEAKPSPVIQITRGDQFVKDVNLVIPPAPVKTSQPAAPAKPAQPANPKTSGSTNTATPPAKPTATSVSTTGKGTAAANPVAPTEKKQPDPRVVTTTRSPRPAPVDADDDDEEEAAGNGMKKPAPGPAKS